MFRIKPVLMAILAAAMATMLSLPAEAGQGKFRSGRHIHATAGHHHSYRLHSHRGDFARRDHRHAGKFRARHHHRRIADIPYTHRLKRRFSDGRYDYSRYDKSSIRYSRYGVESGRYYDAGGSLVISIGQDEKIGRAHV